MHRDIKPGNVWLTAEGSARIGDFGLAIAMAIAMDRTRITQGDVIMGTLLYMSPEQAMGGDVGERSDLYSLGCMLYEMATGGATLPGRRRAVDYRSTPEHPTGVSCMAEARSAARAGDPDPAPAGKGPRSEARLGLGGLAGPRVG